MTKFWGKILTDGKLVKSETADFDGDIQTALLAAIEHFSKSFDISAPMWQTLHTKQMGLFRKVMFRPDDFIDNFPYDSFELQMLDEE